MLPTIAIIGRPNVGKSTLFNRLIGLRCAITSSVPGTTRDRIFHEAEIGGYRVILVDTGGMEFEKKQNIEADVQLQARLGIEEADVVFFVLDAAEPLTAGDRDSAQLLRKSKKPVIVIAHKADCKKSEEGLSELFELGLGEGIAVSSIHNMGLADLDDAAAKIFKKMRMKKERFKKSLSTRIAIVGKPNVGKSSLVNALVGREQLIVSDIPGTTIDATDTAMEFMKKDFVLIDTAGLRRRGKVRKGLEKFGFFRALRAISRADIACLVIDGSTGIANQDLHVGEYILDSGKGCMIVVNKCDLMDEPGEEKKKFLNLLSYRMPFVPWAPVLFVSALNKKNVVKIFELAERIKEERRKKVSEAEFSVFVKTVVMSHSPSRSSKNIVISSGSQTGIEPPTFTFQTNAPDNIHFSYRRFLENEIRRKYGFYGTAIRLEFMLHR